MRLLIVTASLWLGGCISSGTTTSDPMQETAEWRWALPSYMPVPRVPADNPMSEAKFQLGRALFYDVRLSGNGLQSCASCHQQDKAFTDALPVSPGSTGEHTPRNSQPLANVAWHPTLTWANPSLVSLERQMEVPLFGENPVEMGINDANKSEVLNRIRNDNSYVQQFAKVFPDEPSPISFGNIIKAIAAFQRGILSTDSKYDRYLQGKAELTSAELRGKDLFFGEKAECFHCHGSFNFNDQVVHAGSRLVETLFHNTGLYNIDGKGGFPFPNRGVFEFTGIATDMGQFRAPSLRNVAMTAPYMHDGSMHSLEEVLDFYAAGGRVISSGPNAGDGRLNPYKSDLIVRISINEEEKRDLVAFLKTLTDENLLSNPRFSNPHTAGSK